MFGDYYQEDENYGVQFKEGEADAIIKDVEIGISRSGKDMATLTIEIVGQGTLKTWLVDDSSSEDAIERTNRTLTRFFDCFHIQRGNFRPNSWIGKRGTVEIKRAKPNQDGKQFYEIGKFVIDHSGQSTNSRQPVQRWQTQPARPQQTRPQAHQQYQPPQYSQYEHGPDDAELDNIPF